MVAAGPGPANASRGDERQGFHALVRKAQAGDREAMDSVLAILDPYLRHLAGSYADPLKPEESTTDLMQESSLRAWERLKDFEGGFGDDETFIAFRAWLGQIIRRLGLNARRDRRRKRRSPEKKILRLDPSQKTPIGGASIQPVDREMTPSSSARSRERARKIETALQGIPDPTDARIARWRLFEGKTFKQISESLDMEYSKVRRRYQLTVERLQRDLRELF